MWIVPIHMHMHTHTFPLCIHMYIIYIYRHLIYLFTREDGQNFNIIQWISDISGPRMSCKSNAPWKRRSCSKASKALGRHTSFAQLRPFRSEADDGRAERGLLTDCNASMESWVEVMQSDAKWCTDLVKPLNYRRGFTMLQIGMWCCGLKALSGSRPQCFGFNGLDKFCCKPVSRNMNSWLLQWIQWMWRHVL